MYQYKWDPETGGYELTTTAEGIVGRELRPVYALELDTLGFDAYWQYPHDEQTPLLWAENNILSYHGRVVAKLWHGSYFQTPEIEIIEKNLVLQPVDIPRMIQKNKIILDALVRDTLINIYSIYQSYHDKYDILYVAFSGGKDSIVALDLVHRALPKDSYIVLFGNTGMELPDTYPFIETVRKHYSDISLYECKAVLPSVESWKIFGPPARGIRWCCSVHKTAPQIQFLRKYLGKTYIRSLAFTGIRSEESVSRSQYETLSFGKKHAGQDSCHPILSWNSAELYLYIFSEHLPMNEAYKKGCPRVGCLVCPMSGGRHEYIKMQNYHDEMMQYLSIIRNTSSKQFDNEQEMDRFIDEGGWNARRSGRELNIGQMLVQEENTDTHLILHVQTATNDWKDWIKTIGDFAQLSATEYLISSKNATYQFSVISEAENTLKVTLPLSKSGQSEIYFLSLFKSVFRKAAYCVRCGVCETECKYGFINMSGNSKEIVSPNCKKCLQCHKIDYGCLRYTSIKLPLTGREKKMIGLDRYLTFGFRKNWLVAYFQNTETFWTKNDLGSKMIPVCKKFLRDAGVLSEKNELVNLGKCLQALGPDATLTWAIMAINLSYTPQMNWYVMNINPNTTYTRADILNHLPEDITPKVKGNIVAAYRGIMKDTPIGDELKMGVLSMRGTTMISLIRKEWDTPDHIAILYSLYKYAEANADEDGKKDPEQYRFTLTQLFMRDADTPGISPVHIFSLERETMKRVLSGLAVEYPEFISVSFTHDLENISLSPEKSSEEVLIKLSQGGEI